MRIADIARLCRDRRNLELPESRDCQTSKLESKTLPLMNAEQELRFASTAIFRQR
jgi:hypothetical protein